MRETALLSPLLEDGEGLFCLCLASKAFFISCPPRAPHPPPIAPWLRLSSLGSVPYGGADSIWGRRFPGVRSLAHLCAEPVRGRLGPGGHWRQAAVDRCLQTADLDPPPQPLPSLPPPSGSGSCIKRRERGAPQQRWVSAPWRAPASSCCPSWVLPCCCCYLCWAPVPRRMLSSSPEPWTSSPPWRTPPMRRSWSVSPCPRFPWAAVVPPLYLLSSLLLTPFPESGRGKMSEKSRLPLSSSQQSCPRSSEQHEPPLQGSGTCCQYLGQRSLSFHPSSNPFCLRYPKVECVCGSGDP